MLNKKMQEVSNTIARVIINVFPPRYLQFLFDGKIKLKDLTGQILFECCKYAYDQSMPKKSLRAHLQGYTDDDERMMYQRTINYIYNLREKDYETIKRQSGIDVPDLLAPPMENIKEKLGGYSFNDFQFWEINNVHDMQLIKAILSGRIANKNFTKENFRDYSNEYDTSVNEFINLSKSNDVTEQVFSSLAFFVLSWKYSFDFYYKIAEEMENSKIEEIPNLSRRCSLFCGPIGIDSYLNFTNLVQKRGILYTDSRLILLREKFIPEFVHLKDGSEFERMEQQYCEAIATIENMLLSMTYMGENIREWFLHNSSVEDWASVMGEYNVFTAFAPDKKWTSKRIRYVKNIYAVINRINKNPDFRS